LRILAKAEAKCGKWPK